MKSKVKLLVVPAITVLVVAVITVLVFRVGHTRTKGPGSFSVSKPPLKLTLKKVSIVTAFNDSPRTRQEYQVDVWCFLERTDGKMINNEDNVTLGFIQLLASDGERIPHTGTFANTMYSSRFVPREYAPGKKIDFSQNARVLWHSLFVKAEHVHKLSNVTITVYLGLTNRDKKPEPFQFDGIHLPVK